MGTLRLGRDMEHMDASSGGSSSPKILMESGEQPHVLAVDDNLIDRKVVEKLLKNSSCKGKNSATTFFPFFKGLQGFCHLFFSLISGLLFVGYKFRLKSLLLIDMDN